MKHVMVAALLAGCAWASAGLVGYSRFPWKPGALLAFVGAVWLVARARMPPDAVEATAIGVFALVLFFRQWLFPGKPETKPPDSPPSD